LSYIPNGNLYWDILIYGIDSSSTRPYAQT